MAAACRFFAAGVDALQGVSHPYGSTPTAERMEVDRMTVEVRALLIVTAEDDYSADQVFSLIRHAGHVYPPSTVQVVEQSRELVDE